MLRTFALTYFLRLSVKIFSVEIFFSHHTNVLKIHVIVLVILLGNLILHCFIVANDQIGKIDFHDIIGFFSMLRGLCAGI